MVGNGGEEEEETSSRTRVMVGQISATTIDKGKEFNPQLAFFLGQKEEKKKVQYESLAHMVFVPLFSKQPSQYY